MMGWMDGGYWGDGGQTNRGEYCARMLKATTLLQTHERQSDQMILVLRQTRNGTDTIL